MGFGRGYVLRKWGVLRSPGRLARVVAVDGAVCLGQIVVDRSVAGIAARARGFRATRRRERFPASALIGQATPDGTLRTLRRRAQRRARLRAGETP
jgi:hypothetical protein